jgi:hypothetical protein
MTWASTSFRISVMARWAATPSTCEFANAVPASTRVAAPVASASLGSRSQLPFEITSSIRYFVVVGSTRPDRRFTSINNSPNASRLRCFHTSARASPHAPGVMPFFTELAASAGRAVPGVRSVRAGTSRSYADGRCAYLPRRAGAIKGETAEATFPSKIQICPHFFRT